MKKSTKVLFKITAIISMLMAVAFMIYGIMLIFNIGGIKDFIIDIIQKSQNIHDPNDIKFEVYLTIGDAFMSVLLNSYCAGVYFKISKAKSILIGGSRVVLYLGILQCLFLISIVPGVMAIIASTILKKQESTIINRPRQEQENNVDVVSERIKDMKAQKEKGLITQEQYDRFLNDTIEKIAKINIANGVELKSNDTLQEKIAQLKQEKENKKDEE